MRIWTSLFVLFTVACGSSGSGGSGQTTGGAAGSGTGGSGGIGSTAGSGAAAGSGSSAGSGGAGTGGTSTGGSGGNAGQPACTPTSGTEELNAGCDQVRVGIIEHAGQAPRLDLRARVSAGEGCVIIDEIILGTEANPLQLIDTGGIEAVEYANRLLETEADPDIAALCSDEAKRFEPFGFIAKGRRDGGTFTAKCGAAGTGSGRPPHVVLSCHSGIAEAPFSGNSIVDSVGPYTNTTLWSAFRHPPGTGKLTSGGPNVRIIPFVPPFSALPPLSAFDTTGWSMSFSDTTISGQEMSQLSALNNSDVLGTQVCPPIQPNDPFPNPSPVYLAKVSGQSSEGAFSSEILVDICTRVPKSP